MTDELILGVTTGQIGPRLYFYLGRLVCTVRRTNHTSSSVLLQLFSWSITNLLIIFATIECLIHKTWYCQMFCFPTPQTLLNFCDMKERKVETPHIGWNQRILSVSALKWTWTISRWCQIICCHCTNWFSLIASAPLWHCKTVIVNV